MFLVGDPCKTSFATDTVGGGTTQVIVSCSDYLLILAPLPCFLGMCLDFSSSKSNKKHAATT